MLAAHGRVCVTAHRAGSAVWRLHPRGPQSGPQRSASGSGIVPLRGVLYGAGWARPRRLRVAAAGGRHVIRRHRASPPEPHGHCEGVTECRGSFCERARRWLCASKLSVFWWSRVDVWSLLTIPAECSNSMSSIRLLGPLHAASPTKPSADAVRTLQDTSEDHVSSDVPDITISSSLRWQWLCMAAQRAHTAFKPLTWQRPVSHIR